MENLKEKTESVLQKLDKMLQAVFGGYSIKRVLVVVFSINLIVMFWVFTTKENFLAVLPQMIGFIWMLLGYNNAEKKREVAAEIEKAKIDKQTNLENI